MAATEAPPPVTQSLAGTPDQQAQHWVLRLASREMTAGEMSNFEAWLALAPSHRTAFDRERALWQALEVGRHRSVSQRRPHKTFLPFSAAGLAACLVAGVTGPQILIQLQATHTAPAHRVRHLTLPDGSHASLDAGTAVAVHYSGGERRIELLRGRGWFEVRHDDLRPFRVAAGDGMTEDIGTAFEVARARGETEVAVTEGAVRVMAAEGDVGLVIQQAQRAHYGIDGVAQRISDLPVTTVAAWRRGIIVVEEQPLDEAVKAVGRYRKGFTFVQADVSKLAPVSGVFRTEAPEEALEVLARAGGLRVERWPGSIIVLKK